MRAWKSIGITLAAFTLPLLTNIATANADWDAITQKAKEQTVYFNAWGGGENINAYIDWAAKETEKQFGVKVKHVKITDAAEVVKRIQTEKDAGRDKAGSVDLMWVNGENFKALKTAGLLYGPWAESVPSWQVVDTNKPVQQDFSETTDGLEAPWGTAQLTFISDSRFMKQAPDSATALLDYAKANKGRITYPKPPAFHGTTLLKQLLIELSESSPAIQKPIKSLKEGEFEKTTQPLWNYLDQLHSVAWREGKSFPKGIAEMHQMLADGEIHLSLTFNPNEGANLIANEQLPKTAYSFGFKQGTIGNVHFVAIPFNAKAKEGAQVFANFLMSPEAQARKANIKVWGDPSILDISKLSDEQQEVMNKKALGSLKEAVPTLPEPHASWVGALEAEWTKRYGSQ